ncbi:aldo kereductase [Rhizoctonia solani]|uniref:Aldo kereductase n=1 Tax=Rhizoctonia solani TaxID=456999 RepID=A0A8H7M1S2_9AGAM|nr:aldo kereductase [Rhizoctonia solani]
MYYHGYLYDDSTHWQFEFAYYWFWSYAVVCVWMHLGMLAINLSPQGIGGMTYGSFVSSEDGPRLSVLDQLLELGRTHWDTARGCGDSEELISNWFKRTGKYDQIFLVTKFGVDPSQPGGLRANGTPKCTEKCFNDYLEKLGVDIISLPGKIRHIGLSQPSPATIRRAHKVHPIAAIQVEYSPFERLIEQQEHLLEIARELVTAVMAYSPLGKGLLTEQTTSQDHFSDGDFRKQIRKYSQENFQKILKLIDGFKQIGKAHDATSGQVALNSQVVLSRLQRIECIEEIFGGSRTKLTTEELQTPRKLVDETEIVDAQYPPVLQAIYFLRPQGRKIRPASYFALLGFPNVVRVIGELAGPFQPLSANPRIQRVKALDCLSNTTTRVSRILLWAHKGSHVCGNTTTFPAAQLPTKPTSTSYENACRHVLSQRFRQLLQKSATLAAVVVFVSTLNLRGPILSSIFTNAIHISLAFVRHITYTGCSKNSPTSPSNPRPKTLVAELGSLSLLYLALYAVSGLVLAECYATFVSNHSRYPWSVNERHVMLCWGNTLLGVTYAALDGIQHRNPAWLRRYGGFTQRRSTATWKSVSRSAVLAAIRTEPVFTLYDAWRSFLATLVILVLAHVCFAIDDTCHVGRRGEWFEINASQVIHLSQFKEDPNAVLIAGLQSQDPYYKYFAFAELANVVSTRPPRRVALFSDLKANPTAWEQVCRECLLFLGKDYTRVIGRSGPASTAVTSAPSAPVTSKSSTLSTGPVYKHPTQSTGPIDAFVGAANTVATVIPANLSVPAIFLPTPHPTASAPSSVPSITQPWKFNLPNLVDFDKLIGKLPPVWARRVRSVVRDRKEAVLEGLLEGRAADVWIVEALSTLIAQSLHEDPYGRVQRDIPRVLEAFVSYLGALEQLIEEVNADLTPESEDAVRAVVQPVADALREGIRMIVLEFGHRLKAFTFPPRVAKRLQTMVDYL